MHLVRREEFDAVQAMAAKARRAQEMLEGRVSALEARLGRKPGKKPARKAKAKRRAPPPSRPKPSPDSSPDSAFCDAFEACLGSKGFGRLPLVVGRGYPY
jgi:hypothetical protein